MKRYYMLETNDADKSAELYIFGDITSYPWYEDDVSAYGLVKQIILRSISTATAGKSKKVWPSTMR